MSLIVDIEKRLGAFTLRAQLEAEGGVLGLLGASGCGKSMTLKCIAGIETPDRGRIVLDGTTLFDSEARVNLAPQKRRVSAIPAASRGCRKNWRGYGMRWQRRTATSST